MPLPPKAIAPGSVSKAPPSSNPPALHPQPKPIGPAKGGPPPHPLIPRKPTPGPPIPPKKFASGTSARALIGIGDKQGGHATSKHLNIADKDLGSRFKEKHVKSDTVGKFASLRDQRAAAALVRNSPEFRQVRADLRNAPQGSSLPLRVPAPRGGEPRIRNAERSNPGKVTPQGAPTIFAKVVKGPRGLGAQTLYGEPAQPPGAPPRPMGVLKSAAKPPGKSPPKK